MTTIRKSQPVLVGDRTPENVSVDLLFEFFGSSATAERMAEVFEALEPHEVRGAADGRAFAAIRALHRAGSTVSAATVSDALRSDPDARDAYFEALKRRTDANHASPSPRQALEAARLIRQDYQTRQLRQQVERVLGVLEKGNAFEDVAVGLREALATVEQSESPKGNSWTARLVANQDAWATVAPPKREWLLRDARSSLSNGVLPLGKVGLFISEGGLGKTMALVQCAIAVATGSTWLGSYSTKPGRVLLILGEEDAEEVRRRFYNAVKASRYAPPKDG
jgi:hypothetical protein